MPLTWIIKEITAKASAETEGWIRNAVRVFQCQASEPTSPVAAEHATSVSLSIPGIGAAHPEDSSLKVRNRKADPVDGTRLLFLVVVRYDENVWLENPLSMPVQVSYGDMEIQESYYEDCTTPTPKIAINTAGDPFDENPTRDSAITVITIEKNVAGSTNYSSYAALRKKVNSGSTTIDGQAYGAGELYVKAVGLSKVQVLNAVSFRTLTSTIYSNPAGWDQIFQSRGRREKVGSDRIDIHDPVTGRVVDYLWPLNADGTKKSAVSDKGDPITLKPYAATSISALV